MALLSNAGYYAPGRGSGRSVNTTTLTGPRLLERFMFAS